MAVLKKLGCGCLTVIVAAVVVGVVALKSCDSKTYGISGTWTAVSGTNAGQSFWFDESTARARLVTGLDRSMDGVFNTREASVLTLTMAGGTSDGTSEITVEYGKKKAVITLPSGDSVEFEGDIQKEGAAVDGTLRQIGNAANYFLFDNAAGTFSSAINGTELSGTYTERNAVVAYCRFTTLHIGTVDQPCNQIINVLIDRTDANTFRSATGVWKRQ